MGKAWAILERTNLLQMRLMLIWNSNVQNLQPLLTVLGEVARHGSYANTLKKKRRKSILVLCLKRKLNRINVNLSFVM